MKFQKGDHVKLTVAVYQHPAGTETIIEGECDNCATPDCGGYKTPLITPAGNAIVIDSTVLELVQPKDLYFNDQIVPIVNGVVSFINICSHDWKVYKGLSYKEDYCTKCNECKNKRGLYE